MIANVSQIALESISEDLNSKLFLGGHARTVAYLGRGLGGLEPPPSLRLFHFIIRRVRCRTLAVYVYTTPDYTVALEQH